MEPSSERMTSCEPALAQESAHSRLIGLSRFFVNAHAESSTYPSTKTLFCCAERSKHDTPTIAISANTRVKRLGVIAIVGSPYLGQDSRLWFAGMLTLPFKAARVAMENT